MKTTHRFAIGAITAALVVGGASAAFAGGENGGAGGVGKAARIEFACEHRDEIVPLLTARQADLTTRISLLADASADATAAGKDAAAARIDRRSDTLEHRLDKVTTRLSDAPAWIAEHCS